MVSKTLQKQQKRESSKKRLSPYRGEIPKGIDFKRYRVASPSELLSEPIKDRRQATSTSLGEIKNSQGGFGWVTGR